MSYLENGFTSLFFRLKLKGDYDTSLIYPKEHLFLVIKQTNFYKKQSKFLLRNIDNFLSSYIVALRFLAAMPESVVQDTKRDGVQRQHEEELVYSVCLCLYMCFLCNPTVMFQSAKSGCYNQLLQFHKENSLHFKKIEVLITEDIPSFLTVIFRLIV